MSSDQCDTPSVTLTEATDPDPARQATSPKPILISGQTPPTPSPVQGHASKRSLTGSDLFSGLRIISNVQQESDLNDPSGFPDCHVITSIDEFEFKGIIGCGSSAVVHSAIYLPLNKRVAVKVIDLDMFERNQIDELRTQILLFLDDTGSCLDIMKNSFPEGLDESSIAVILKQALEGLAYFHKNGHIHRDVKAGNLLMDEDGSVLLADFGVSSSLMETGGRGLRKTFVGTPCWMAPEVMEQAGYDYKADVWSFGITAIELASGHAPFAKLPPLKVLMMTLSNDPPTLVRETSKHKYSRLLKEMVDMCLNKDPSKRPTSEKLLQHPFFKQTKKKEYLIKTLLSEIQPLEQRQHRRIQQKEIFNAKTDEWNFNDDEEEQQPTSGSTDIHPPKRHISFGDVVIRSPQLNAEPSSALLNTNTSQPAEILAATPPKKSRFVIEDTTRDGVEQNKGLSSPGWPTASELTDTRFNNSYDVVETGVKIGRFSINQLSRQPSATEHASSASLDSKQMSRTVSHDNTGLGNNTNHTGNSSISHGASLSCDSVFASLGLPLARERSGQSRSFTTQYHPMDQEGLKGIMRAEHFKKIENTSSSGNHLAAEKADGTYHSPESSLSSISSSFPSYPYSRDQTFRVPCDPVIVAIFHSQIEEMLKHNEAQRLLLHDLFQTMSIKSKENGTTENMSDTQTLLAQQLHFGNSGKAGHHTNSFSEADLATIDSLQRQFELLTREKTTLKNENDSLRREIEQLQRKRSSDQAHE
ncbi:hypothetical protein DFQ30_001319 [Apophysomyces sp. BC1015]|nr:hypothetical protein DFQ30_001319 [Apophysomyces sp. BC1015]